jgi:predicted dehydrogenase
MKVLIIGLGSVGQRHLRNLRELMGDGVELLAYRTRGLTHVLNDAQEITAPAGLHERYDLRVFTDLDAALAKRPVAAFICNPNSLHIPMAIAAANAGCHLFIEKPLSNSLEGIGDLLSLVERKNLVGFVAYQLRFHPCLQTAERLLREETIGRVLAVRAENGEYMPGWHPYEDYRQAYASKREGGGGVILAQSHEIDYLYWLFGMPRCVYAIGGHLSNLEMDVEDVASILMQCSGDEVAFPVHLHLDYLQRPAKRTCQIIGERGTISINLRTQTVEVHRDGSNQPFVYDYGNLSRNQLFLEELKQFLACVRGEAQPVVSLRDGIQTLRVALAAKDSLVTGQAIELDGVD